MLNEVLPDKAHVLPACQGVRTMPEHRAATAAVSVFATLAIAGALAPVGLASSAVAQEGVVLEDIIISATRSPLEASKVGASVSVVTGEELARSGATFLGDALQRLPGVSFTQNGPRGTVSNLRLRGLRGQYVSVFIDGVKVSDPSQPQTTPDFANIPVMDVERIEVLKGPQSTLYGGDAVAGIINIVTRRPEKDGLSHAYRLERGGNATTQGVYSLSGSAEEGYITLSAQGIDTNGFSAADAEDGNSEADGLGFGALGFKGEYNLGPDSALFANLRVTRADADYDSGFPISDADFRQETDTLSGRLGARWAMLDGRLENTASVQLFTIDRRNFDNFPRQSVGKRYRADYLGQYRFSERFSLMFGGDAERTVAGSGDMRDAGIIGGFVQVLAEPIDNLSLALNARYDHHDEFGGFDTYRASAAYTIAATDTTLRASAGSGFRAPSIYELYEPGLGNTALKPEESLGFDAGISQGLFGSRLVLAATYFHNEVDDLILYRFDPAGPDYYQANALVRTQGLELEAKLTPVDWLSLDASYTYTDADSDDTNALIRIPVHTASAELILRPTQKLELAFNARMAAGADEPLGTDLDDYVVVGANASYAHSDRLSVFVRAENLFDEQYQVVRGYGTGRRTFYAGIRGSF